MSTTVYVNGTAYQLPAKGDNYDWASGTTGLSALITALTNSTFQPNTGAGLPLTAALDLGSSYGIKVLTVTSKSANPAASGIVRLASGDAVVWRNTANGADVSLSKGTADQLQWSGVDLTGNPQAIYSTAAGQSIPNAAATIVNFATQELDTAAAVTTGATWKFTVPTGKGGLYHVEAAITWNAIDASGTDTLQLFKNGALVRTLSKVVKPGAGTIQAGSCTVSLAAGDYIDIRVTQNSGGALAITTSAAENYVCIDRVVS